MGVFLHHASIWYFYLHTGKWELPPSTLYTHFGKSSVALFFMITGFLFTYKIIECRDKGVDWSHIYISRALRLTPLYLLAISLLFFLVFAASGFNIHDGGFTTPSGLLQWATFTIGGAPDLNGFKYTPVIEAGVSWTLPYEWLFYVSLPMLALAMGTRLSIWSVIASAASSVAIAVAMPDLRNSLLLIFCGGVAAAFCVRSQKLCAQLSGTAGSMVALALLAVCVAAFKGTNKFPETLLLTGVFIIIACGNTLFGILTWPPSRLIGDMGYSIYLLHGFALFLAFQGLSLTLPAGHSPLDHWTIVLALVVPLVAVCYASFRLIELPAMKMVPCVHSWFARRL